MSPLCPCRNQGLSESDEVLVELPRKLWQSIAFFLCRRVCFVCLCVLSPPLLGRLPIVNYWHQALGIIGSVPDTCYHKSTQKRLFCVGRKAYWFICVNLSKHATLYMQLEAYVLVNLPRCTAHSSDPITTFYSRGLYEKTLVAVWPMACRQKKINHISLLHGFLLQICILRKQWLLFDRWHEDRRKLITSACFMASYCEAVLWKNSCCCLTNGMQPEENKSH